MTDKIVIPESADELQEMLQDNARFGPVMANPEARDDFLRKYAAAWNKKNAEALAEQREQMQLVVAEMLDVERKKAPRVGITSSGRPVLEPGSPARRQSAYNRAAHGHHLNGTFETFGDFMRGVTMEGAGRQYRDSQELAGRISKVKEIQNSFGTDIPSDGGFLVPEEFRSDLLMLALESAVVRPRATVIPMGSQTLAIPAVDSTSNATTVFGGITTTWVDESSAPAESSAKFEQVKLDAKKLMAYCTVPSELPNDAPAFSAFLDSALPQAMAFEEDYRFMQGSGVGQPLGFINCDASIAVTAVSGQGASTIIVDNLAAMYARMLPSSLMKAIWVADIGTFPQLALMAVQGVIGNSTPVWMNNGVIDAPPITIYGRPVYFTEKAVALGTTGDINFVDPAFYLIGDRQAITASASPHFAFSTDKIAYKIIERVDGRPWMQSALTPKNSGSTLSPFVQLSSTRT